MKTARDIDFLIFLSVFLQHNKHSTRYWFLVVPADFSLQESTSFLLNWTFRMPNCSLRSRWWKQWQRHRESCPCDQIMHMFPVKHQSRSSSGWKKSCIKEKRHYFSARHETKEWKFLIFHCTQHWGGSAVGWMNKNTAQEDITPAYHQKEVFALACPDQGSRSTYGALRDLTNNTSMGRSDMSSSRNLPVGSEEVRGGDRIIRL